MVMLWISVVVSVCQTVCVNAQMMEEKDQAVAKHEWRLKMMMRLFGGVFLFGIPIVLFVPGA